MTIAAPDFPVIVLAGGLGTRIRGVLGDTPKVLAPIGGHPFLDHLLAWLAAHQVTRVTLCLGHLAAKVTAHLATQTPPIPLVVETVVEPHPLGTAGAVRLAAAGLPAGGLVVMNGDTWLDLGLQAVLTRHRQHHADISLVCVRVADSSRYGRVEVDDSGAVLSFREKDDSHVGPALVSAGIVVLSAAARDRLVSGAGPSLERDFLQVQPAGTILAQVVEGMFIDIGTPESLRQAPTTIVSPLTIG